MIAYAGSGSRDYLRRPVASHRRSAWELQAVVRGACAPLLPDAARPRFRRAPWLWVFPPEVAHGWIGDGSLCTVAVVHLPTVPALLDAAGTGDRGVPGDELDRVAAAIDAVVRDRARPTSHAGVRAALAEAAMVALACRGVPETDVQPGPAEAASRVQAAEDFLRARLAEGVGVADAAAAVGLSPAHFRRLVRSVRGSSAREMLRQLRMQRSAEVLGRGGATLAEAAASCGLGSASSLCRLRRSRPDPR